MSSISLNFSLIFKIDLGVLSVDYVCTRVCCVQRLATSFSQTNKTTTGMLAQQINPFIRVGPIGGNLLFLLVYFLLLGFLW